MEHVVLLWVNVGVPIPPPYITVSISQLTPSLSHPPPLSLSSLLLSLLSFSLFSPSPHLSPSLPHLSLSLRYGRPYVYDEKYHPTKWVADRAIAYLEAQATAQQQQQQQQQRTTTNFLAKISFHRPHSPYDPPARILDSITEVRNNLLTPLYCRLTPNKQPINTLLLVSWIPSPTGRPPPHGAVHRGGGQTVDSDALK